MSITLSHQWISWMASMTWQVAVLVAVVWALSRVLGRASASLRHTLWLMVFLRLMLPPDLSVPWSLGTLLAKAPVRMELGLDLPQTETNLPPVKTRQGDSASVKVPNDAEDVSPLGLEQSLHSRPIQSVDSYPILSVLVLSWLFVSTLLGAGMLVQWARFRNRVLQGAVRAPAAIEETVSELCGRMGVHRRVSVRLSDAVSTACLLGVVRPRILLPADNLERLSPESLRHVLAHELCHVRRHDLLFGWIAALLCCVYWFHPLVWLAHGYLRREREMATDDLVLRAAGEDGGRYASTIVRVAEVSRGGAPAVAGFLGAVEASENLLQRIRSVNDGARPRRMGWGSALVLLGVSLFLPMAVWTQASPPPTADVEAEIVAHYQAAPADVQEYVRWTAGNFGRSGLWLPENALETLTAEEREAKIVHLVEALQGEYGRHLCQGIAEAGVLRDPRLLSGLLTVATYHRDDGDYDCRAKWMAVESLGRLGMPEAAPALIPLVDHGNQNTRMWAQASLARLTGEKHGADKAAWGAWWNASGKEPRLSETDLKPWTPPAGVEIPVTGGPQTPPEILKTSPEIGAIDVDPSIAELQVTFEQDMRGGFSWTGGGEVYPELTGKPHWLDARNCVLPVKLQPGKFYRLGINSKSHGNFRGVNGIPARVRALYFVTAGATDEEKQKALAPAVVSMEPANGAEGVSSQVTELTVTFERPMGGGFSWTKTDGAYPETTGAPHWEEDRMTCHLPVKLAPNTSYELSLNSAYHINFSSQWGVPLEPVLWRFKTGN